MVRIGISVEGSTEVHFIQKLLQPYLEKKRIFITPVSMRGNISVDRVKYEINKLMYSFDYVSTFYDFYGFKGIKEEDTKEIL
jgi:ribosome-interacting GTPase 1